MLKRKNQNKQTKTEFKKLNFNSDVFLKVSFWNTLLKLYFVFNKFRKLQPPKSQLNCEKLKYSDYWNTDYSQSRFQFQFTLYSQLVKP